jgi:hypothetical protein
MTTRIAGRHRSTKTWSPPPPPTSLLLVDYLESGQFPRRLATPGRPATPGLPRRPAARPSVSRPSINWRMLGTAVPAVLAGIAVAVILGGFALLRSPGGSGGRQATPARTPPRVSALPPSASPPRPTQRPRPHGTAGRRSPPGYQPLPIAVPAAGAAPSASPRAAQRKPPAIVARYLITSQGPGGFQGEIQVTNNGTQPIAGWQIVVALPDDQVLSFSNASGFISNGILLLQPGPGSQAVQPGGGTLSVFFVAEGTQTTPEACAFNQVVCG